MEIQSIEQLRAILGSPRIESTKKIYDHLNPRMLNFIEHSPLMFIATADQEGFPTISPKGDGIGAVKVLNDKTLLIPERKGNKIAVSFENIIRGSKAGLIFIVPGTNEILRVHGSPKIIHDSKLNKEMKSLTHEALLVLKVEVNNAYFHCGKAFLRSKIWCEDLEKSKLKISFGEEIAENMNKERTFIEDFDKGVDERYKTEL
ncbi:MAG: pyridoxamine 5'-phosphate oxidase family protein [Oleiphilaceae bacterium]|nr:pyridoxamine 5'-phosphate oxidase family protein [Oleiphilaceae bacterium]